MVCVVVVVLVLLLRGCRWQRLGGFRGVKWCRYGECGCRGGELRRGQLYLRGYSAAGWEVAVAFRRVGRWEDYGPSLAASHPLAVEGFR